MSYYSHVRHHLVPMLSGKSILYLILKWKIGQTHSPIYAEGTVDDSVSGMRFLLHVLTLSSSVSSKLFL
jgi:hypothetical protein